jgi:PAS domain S-box-containing protein
MIDQTNRQSILIIEDEAIVAEDLSHKVKALGYDVVGVLSTGEQAISAAQQSTIDLVLLDIQLEGHIDGIETAKTLRQLCDSAIVFTTAHSDPETLKKANDTAPCGYILKPFGERDLAVQLALALHKHRASRALRKEIAEREEAQQKLQRSEAILLRAQRGAKAGVWEIDLRTGQYTWSKPYYDLFDLDHSVQASLDVWLPRIHPEDRSRIATLHQESIQGHRDQDMQFRILKSDGSVRWINRKGQVEFNEDGKAIRINGISFDITDRKQAEEAINAVALFPAQNPSPVLRIDMAGVLLYMNAASERLLRELRLRQGQPVPAFLRDLVHESLRNGRSIQVEQTIASCHYIVSATPLVKENYANLYWTDITERKRTEEALRVSDERFRTLGDHMAQLAWMIDQSGDAVWFNRRWYDYTGTTPEQVRGWGWRTVHHPDHEERVVASWLHAFSTGEPWEDTFPLRRADGEYRWFLTRAIPIRDEQGLILRWFGTNTEITDLRESQTALQRSQEHLRSILETAVDGIFTLDEGGTIESVNPAVERLFQYPAEELIGHNVKVLMPEPDPSQHDGYSKSFSDSGEEKIISIGREVIGRRQDGSLFPAELSISESSLPGKRFFTGIVRDVSLRKKAEESLRETSALLNTLLLRAPIGFAFFDNEMRYRLVNEALAEMNGVSVANHIGRTLHEVVPDLAQEAQKVLEEVIRTKKPLLDHEFSGSTVKEPGVVRYWNESWYPISGDGFLGVGVLVQETTELKRQQQQLRESEERLRLANLATNEAIWDWNVASDHVVWNQNVFSLFGWSEAVATPQSAAWWVERVHPDDRSRVVDHFFAAVNDGMIVSWVDEYRFQKSDGSYRYVLDRAYAVRDASGKAQRMLGTMLDVTERRLAEAALRDNEQRLQQAVDIRTAELLQSQERLRALATQLNLVEQRERQRLATELHDHLQQLLVLGKIQIGQGKRYTVGLPGCESVMKTVDEILSDALVYTRTLVADLSPPVLRDYGLAAGLKWLAESMKKHNLIVTVTVPEDSPKLPEDQTVLLFQSVRELLINASKYAGTRQAIVEMVESEGRLELTVRDEGKGFDLAAAGAAGMTGSTGASCKFGLFSIRERMKALGGWFDIQSEPGKGTCARLALSLQSRMEFDSARGTMALRTAEATSSFEKQREKLLPRASKPTGEQATNEGPTIRILLVDDHAMVRQGLKTLLENYADIQVIGEASNGEEAVLLADQLKPTIIVMDVNMPLMDGIEATAVINERHPEMQIIGLSVNCDSRTETAMKAAGALLVITKEAAVEQLYKNIQEAIHGSLAIEKSSLDLFDWAATQPKGQSTSAATSV